VGFTMATSLVTATTFQLAHCVEEAGFASAEELTADKRIWAVHEVETTVNFCPRNAFLTWVLGGLNYQIEHHLFPRVAHTHYPQIAEIVRRNAAKHGVRYTAQPSLRAALRSHQRHLRALGRRGVPAEIEMG
jgi:linoleoyl-CoA desaturase